MTDLPILIPSKTREQRCKGHRPWWFKAGGHRPWWFKAGGHRPWWFKAGGHIPHSNYVPDEILDGNFRLLIKKALLVRACHALNISRFYVLGAENVREGADIGHDSTPDERVSAPLLIILPMMKKSWTRLCSWKMLMMLSSLETEHMG